MGLMASITVAYPSHLDFLEEIKPKVEAMPGTQITDKPSISAVGGVISCIIDVELPDNFDIRRLRAQMADRLPDVNVNVATSFRRSMWEWRGMDVVIALTSGITVALVLDAVRPAPGRPIVFVADFVA